MWAITSLSLLLFFNNCGRFVEKRKLTLSSFEEESYPWPNDTTTVESSDSMTSEVLFGDIQNNSQENAVFLSKSSLDTVAAVQKSVIRIVASGSFNEIENIQNTLTEPNPRVKMLLTDVDMDEGPKELLYVSSDNTRVVALEMSGDSVGREKFNLALVEPIDRTKENAFSSKYSGEMKMVQVGDNIIWLSTTAAPRVESSLVAVNGAWAEWGDWSPRCSKSCGDGVLARMRLCTSPTPRNGGDMCVGSAVETQTCRQRACLETDCSPYEMFQNGNCVPDPENPPPTGVGGGTTPGSANCPTGKVIDIYGSRCYTPHPFDNILLTHIERLWTFNDSDDGGGSRIREINHTYRISLSHERARGRDAQFTASAYCRMRGYTDVLSFRTATYTAGQGSFRRNAFILCDAITNGMYYGPRGSCPVGANFVGFNYRNITHAQDEQVTYLRSVVCRDNEPGDPPVAYNSNN